MPRLSVYYDPVFLEHRPPDGTFHLPPHDALDFVEPHPDHPDRIRAIRSIITTTLARWTTWEDARPATHDELTRIHTPGYLAELQAAGTRDARLTPETGANPATYDAARHAAGAAIQAAHHAMTTGTDHVAYALVRPSGHHAQPDTADGFCLINNAAVAAAAVRAVDTADRVAILDWDVHHANGTQEAFYDRDDVLVISLHNDFGPWGPHHPQTGGTEEAGAGPGTGYTVNVPLPAGTGDNGYAYAVDTIVTPIVEAYAPDLLLVSAGQDAGLLDPMARNLVTKAGFEHLGRTARDLADAHADGHLALVQEGGYQPSHLAFATLGVLEGTLAVQTGIDEPFLALPEEPQTAEAWIDAAAAAHAEYWPL